MRIDHKTMLEAFEETDGRGDVLSIHREQLTMLTELPFEKFAPILYKLFKWFVDGDETPLEDQYANAILKGLKAHQRNNALRRKAFLVEQTNRAKKGAEARWETKNARGHTENAHGHTENARGHPWHAQVKAEAKAKAKDKALALASVGGSSAAVDTAPPTPISGKEAKKFLAMNAPQIFRRCRACRRQAENQASCACSS